MNLEFFELVIPRQFLANGRCAVANHLTPRIGLVEAKGSIEGGEKLRFAPVSHEYPALVAVNDHLALRMRGGNRRNAIGDRLEKFVLGRVELVFDVRVPGDQAIGVLPASLRDFFVRKIPLEPELCTAGCT